LDELRLRELLLLARDFRRNSFTVDCKRNENRFAMVTPDAFAAKRDVLDLKTDNAHAETLAALRDAAFIFRYEVEFAVSTRSIAASRFSIFTGFTKCSAKPASKLFSMSPFIPKPLIAIPGMCEMARR